MNAATSYPADALFVTFWTDNALGELHLIRDTADHALETRDTIVNRGADKVRHVRAEWIDAAGAVHLIA